MAKKPDRSPEENADLFIAEWQEKYGVALDLARRAAKTTETEAWMENYAHVMTEHRKGVKMNLDEAAACIKSIDQHGPNEEVEKAMKDAVKAIGEMRESHQAWRSKAVDPYRVAAMNCAELRHGTIAAAVRAEQETPLIQNGLADIVKERVSHWPVVKWDDERGVVDVDDEGDAKAVAA